MSTETGGQAFPAHFESHDGMNLRDYFAAKAMQGLFASDTSDWNQEGEWDERARTAYEMADAMLKERGK